MTKTTAARKTAELNSKISYLNTLTTSATAFRSFAELAAKCVDGYVPTLRGSDRNARKLASELKNAGFRAWNPATGKNW